MERRRWAELRGPGWRAPSPKGRGSSGSRAEGTSERGDDEKQPDERRPHPNFVVLQEPDREAPSRVLRHGRRRTAGSLRAPPDGSPPEEHVAELRLEARGGGARNPSVAPTALARGRAGRVVDTTRTRLRAMCDRAKGAGQLARWASRWRIQKVRAPTPGTSPRSRRSSRRRAFAASRASIGASSSA